ncbi:39S ribosomal protein L49, mitochondrial [Platysternon megacephalum]|uniref:39S ribosomal protein L49, mitochondrial n=1 Tax=Platysternon megacephalum TaxID=55544 RepID=A0A4D9DWV2_9SAUR|nr:39S ribosomal protein L49, mitochondrial [Platysternon megacephalum]
MEATQGNPPGDYGSWAFSPTIPIGKFQSIPEGILNPPEGTAPWSCAGQCGIGAQCTQYLVCADTKAIHQLILRWFNSQVQTRPEMVPVLDSSSRTCVSASRGCGEALLVTQVQRAPSADPQLQTVPSFCGTQDSTTAMSLSSPASPWPLPKRTASPLQEP